MVGGMASNDEVVGVGELPDPPTALMGDLAAIAVLAELLDSTAKPALPSVAGARFADVHAVGGVWPCHLEFAHRYGGF